MRNLGILLVVCALAWACGGDGDCTQTDWVGTYELMSSECQDSTVSLTSPLVITAGTTADAIVVAGADEAEFDGCKVTISALIFEIDYELDGNEIKADGVGCTGVYVRQ